MPPTSRVTSYEASEGTVDGRRLHGGPSARCFRRRLSPDCEIWQKNVPTVRTTERRLHHLQEPDDYVALPIPTGPSEGRAPEASVPT